jgi:apolipoprotein N-acyltransferase
MSLTQRRNGAETAMVSSFFASLRPCAGSCLSTVPNPWNMGLLGAVLLWAALPPLDWWPLAWVAPVPWAMLIRRKDLPGRRPYAVLTLVGFCFWMAALHWLRLPHPATSIGWVALSFYFAFYLPVFVGLSRVAVHRGLSVILAAPIVWTGLELARAHLLTGMTMASLGHTQFRWIQLIQLSDLAGTYGVSFVVMLVAASLARMLPCEGRRWTLWPLGPAVAALAAALLYGQTRIDAGAGEPGPRIALIQGSVDIEFLDSLAAMDARTRRMATEYSNLAQRAVTQNPDLDLMVWPETMFPADIVTFEAGATRPPGFEGTEAEFQQKMLAAAQYGMAAMAKTAQSLRLPLVLGANTRHFGPQGQQIFNSAAYVDRDGQLQDRYDKMHLVLFGEYIPFAEYLPWLYRLTPLTGSATAGNRPTAFGLRWGSRTCRIAPNICYESVLSHVIRRQVNALADERREPDILVNLTNDGWFWGSSELDMHLVCAVFRAVECRKPFLIAANTGFSAWIDADGRIQKQGLRHASDIIVAEPRLDQRRSWYLAYGDWFAGLCLAATGLCGLVGICGRVRPRRQL